MENTVKFLEKYLNVKDLDNEALNLVKDFLLLWNIFERVICGKYANKNKFDKAIPHLKEFDDELLESTIKYYKKEYIDFDKLQYLQFRARKSGIEMEELVTTTLTQPNNTSKDDKLKTIIYIIYRYRNNLFHGEKRIESLRYQKDIFKVANKILIETLKKYKQQ